MTDLGPTPQLRVARREVVALATELEETAARLAARSLRVGEAMLALGPTSVLSPATAALAETALAAAGAGPRGLVPTALHLAATGVGSLEALALLSAADEAIRFAGPALETAVGAEARSRLATPAGETALQLVAAYVGTEGAPVLTPAAAPGPPTAPGSLADLLTRLAGVNDGADGQIEVQTLTGPDGRRRHLVLLPGTDVGPFDRSAVRSWPANAAIRSGETTTYERGIIDALAASGVRPGEPVLLVGHSQGGMAAVDLARMRTPYLITNVVTAGSPVGDRELPAVTRLIALENHGDVIPLLDGAPGRDGPGRLTLRFGDGLTDPGASHHLAHYVHGAKAAEESRDPAVQSALADLAPFLGGGSVRSHTWVITRRAGG